MTGCRPPDPPPERLAWSRLTGAACQEVGAPCAAAFQAPLAAWRLEGRPRPARREPTEPNGPGPTPADRRRLIHVSRQTHPRPGGQGRLYGRGQRQAQPWLPVRLVVLEATLRTLGEAPPDPTAPPRGERGAHTGPTVTQVRRMHAARLSRLWSDTDAGSPQER